MSGTTGELGLELGEWFIVEKRNDPKNEEQLFQAAKAGQIEEIKKALKQLPQQQGALRLAVENNDPIAAARILAVAADPAALISVEWLEMAARKQQLAMVELFCNFVDPQTVNGSNALHALAGSDWENKDSSAEHKASSVEGATPIAESKGDAKRGQQDQKPGSETRNKQFRIQLNIAKALLAASQVPLKTASTPQITSQQQNQSFLNKKNQDGDTPLHVAVKKGNVMLVLYFLNINADRRIKNNAAKIPLDVAKELKNTAIINFLQREQQAILPEMENKGEVKTASGAAVHDSKGDAKSESVLPIIDQEIKAAFSVPKMAKQKIKEIFQIQVLKKPGENFILRPIELSDEALIQVIEFSLQEEDENGKNEDNFFNDLLQRLLQDKIFAELHNKNIFSKVFFGRGVPGRMFLGLVEKNPRRAQRMLERMPHSLLYDETGQKRKINYRNADDKKYVEKYADDATLLDYLYAIDQLSKYFIKARAEHNASVKFYRQTVDNLDSFVDLEELYSTVKDNERMLNSMEEYVKAHKNYANFIFYNLKAGRADLAMQQMVKIKIQFAGGLIRISKHHLENLIINIEIIIKQLLAKNSIEGEKHYRSWLQQQYRMISLGLGQFVWLFKAPITEIDRCFTAETNETQLQAATYSELMCQSNKERDLGLNAQLLAAIKQANLSELTKAILAIQEAGQPLEFFDRDGRTPFMHAAEQGFIAGMELLQKLGATIWLRDKNWVNAAMLAAGNGHLSALTWLLQSVQFPINACDKRGRSLLHWAIGSVSDVLIALRQAVVARLLEHKEINLEQKDQKTGETALIAAARKGLPQRNSNHAEAKQNDESIFLLAEARNGFAFILEQLADAGADLKATNHRGESALLLAAKRKDARCIAILLEKLKKLGGKPEGYRAITFPALCEAAQQDDGIIIGLLLEFDKELVNEKDQLKQTALFKAAKKSHLAALTALCAAQPNETVMRNYGIRPSLFETVLSFDAKKVDKFYINEMIEQLLQVKTVVVIADDIAFAKEKYEKYYSISQRCIKLMEGARSAKVRVTAETQETDSAKTEATTETKEVKITRKNVKQFVPSMSTKMLNAQLVKMVAGDLQARTDFIKKCNDDKFILPTDDPVLLQEIMIYFLRLEKQTKFAVSESRSGAPARKTSHQILAKIKNQQAFEVLAFHGPSRTVLAVAVHCGDDEFVKELLMIAPYSQRYQYKHSIEKENDCFDHQVASKEDKREEKDPDKIAKNEIKASLDAKKFSVDFFDLWFFIIKRNQGLKSTRAYCKAIKTIVDYLVADKVNDALNEAYRILLYYRQKEGGLKNETFAKLLNRLLKLPELELGVPFKKPETPTLLTLGTTTRLKNKAKIFKEYIEQHPQFAKVYEAIGKDESLMREEDAARDAAAKAYYEILVSAPPFFYI